MRGSLLIGRFFGIKIFVHWTFSLLIAWVIFLNIRQGLGLYDVLWSVAFIFSVFACLTMHELAHALTAKRFGVQTRDIILLPIGGMARLESIPEIPRQELLVAIAGPLVNFVLSGLLFSVLLIRQESINWANLEHLNSGNFLQMLFAVNLVLGLFNLIPAFPMDGGRILRALLAMKTNRNTATRIAAFIGQVLAVGLAFLGLFSNPFLVVIGIVIFLGAQYESNLVEAQFFLKGYTINNILMRDFQTLSVDDKVSKAIEIILNGQSKDFIVMDQDLVVGTLSRDEIIKCLYEKDEQAAIKNIMNKKLVYLKPSDSLEKLVQQMQTKEFNILPVVENEKLIGVVDSENLFEFILIKQAQKNYSKEVEVE